MRAPAPRAVGLALLVALVPVMALAPVTHADTSPVTEKLGITTGSAHPDRAFQAFDANAVQLYDLDGDGTLELIANNDNNRAYVFDGITGRLLLEIETPHPRYWEARELNGIAVGDVNGNHMPDLVIANSASWVTALEVHPPALPDGEWSTEELWRTFIDPTELDPAYLDNHTAVNDTWTGYAGLDGGVFLADVDGDGKDEAFFQTDDAPGQYSIDDNGTLRWWHDWGDGNGNPVLADIDRDDRYEAVFATDGGRVFVYDARDGWVQCVFNAKDWGADPGSISVPPQLVDVTGDERLEIIVGARQAVNDGTASWMEEQHAAYYAIDHECNPVWGKRFDWGNPHVYMRGAPVDVNADGQVDLVFHDWNTIGHKPGNWETTGPANLFALDGATGDLLWRTTTNTYWSNKDIAVADVRNGGEPEILVVAENAGEDGITIHDYEGRTVDFIGAGEGWLVTRGPTVGDIDGDGFAEVVFPVHKKSDHCPPRNLDVGCRTGAIRVFDTHAAVPGVGHAGIPWSGNHAFNARVEFEGATPRAPGGDLSARVEPAGIGVFSVSLPDVEHAFVRVAGERAVNDSEWHALEHDGDGTWSATLAPMNDETWIVRVTRADDRVRHAFITWHGEGPGRVEGTVDGRGLFESVHLEIEQNGSHVRTLDVDASGRFSVELPPGEYVFTPVSGRGDEGNATPIHLGPAEVHDVTLVLREEDGLFRFLTRGPGFLGALALAAVAGTAVVVRARRRRSV